jgi:dolichol-phosphate mannosyltransferase
MTDQQLPFHKTIIIIPTYNEIDNIEKMVQSLFAVSPHLHVLIIDDGSPDRTAEKVLELKEHFSQLHIIQRAGKLGLGTAYVAGFKWALERSFDFIFEMDCDFSHDPGDIPRLLEGAMQSDLAIGSRYIGGIRIINWPIQRLLLSYGASIYTRLITGLPICDTTGGFKCFRAETLKRLDLDRIFSNGYSFQLELNYKVWRLGLKIKEVPIIFYERRDGASKMNRKIVIEAIFSVFRLRFFSGDKSRD